MERLNVYLAGPLFTVAEREFNASLAKAIQAEDSSVTVVLPQQFADSIFGNNDFLVKMYRYCIRSVDSCDVMVAILEGADADSGTCIEMGYALSEGKRIIGVRTDLRSSEDRGLNLMVANSCSRLLYHPSAGANMPSLAKSITSVLREAGSV